MLKVLNYALFFPSCTIFQLSESRIDVSFNALLAAMKISMKILKQFMNVSVYLSSFQLEIRE